VARVRLSRNRGTAVDLFGADVETNEIKAVVLFILLSFLNNS
jgi:hypothetical protein